MTQPLNKQSTWVSKIKNKHEQLLYMILQQTKHSEETEPKTKGKFMNLKFPNYWVVESLCPWAQDNTNSALVALFADTVDVCADPASHLFITTWTLDGLTCLQNIFSTMFICNNFVKSKSHHKFCEKYSMWKVSYERKIYSNSGISLNDRINAGQK